MDATTEIQSGLRRRVFKRTRCAADLRPAGRYIAKDARDIGCAPIPCDAPHAFAPMSGADMRAGRFMYQVSAGPGGVVETVGNARI